MKNTCTIRPLLFLTSPWFTESFVRRSGVEGRGNFVLRGQSRGNEHRRWYGTERTCRIGDEGITDFCTDPSCSLCCIIKGSPDIEFMGTSRRGILGRGIHTSSTSFKFVSTQWNCLSLNTCLTLRLWSLAPTSVQRIIVMILLGRRCC